MKIKKTVVLRSDLVQEYVKRYYEETGVLLHFSSVEHDQTYKDVWKKVPEASKYEYLKIFVSDREEALNKYLEDANMNNIKPSKFNYAPPYFWSLFNLKGYSLFMNCCYYKGMLRDIIGTTNIHELKIKLYCVEDIRENRYIFASDNKKDMIQYQDKGKYKIWVEE